VTAPAIVVRGATVALCRRTNLRKAFLAPWHEAVVENWLFCLAIAQRETKVAIHQTTLMPNHHHTDVTSSQANLPDFKRLLHGESSKALNALMARERYDQPRQLWDDRATHTMRLLDAEAQGAHMIYGHVNAVAAGLVRTPSEMPGWTFDSGCGRAAPSW
jgi:REP element-mobilizing transposase RayT